MSVRELSINFLHERLGQHGPAYAAVIRPAIVRVEGDRLFIDMDHPALQEAARRFKPEDRMRWPITAPAVPAAPEIKPTVQGPATELEQAILDLIAAHDQVAQEDIGKLLSAPLAQANQAVAELRRRRRVVYCQGCGAKLSLAPFVAGSTAV